MDYSADAIQNRTSRETKNSPLKQESISTALLPLENKPEKSNNSLTLLKIYIELYSQHQALPMNRCDDIASLPNLQDSGYSYNPY